MARGVNGGEPVVDAPAGPMVSSTFSRTASRVMPSDSSAFAAVPSPSWIRPSRMCSVPMKLWLRSLASSWARTRTLRARSVNRSNKRPPLPWWLLLVMSLRGGWVLSLGVTRSVADCLSCRRHRVALWVRCPTSWRPWIFPGWRTDWRAPRLGSANAVTAEDPYLTEIAGHLIGAGGKRLRPVLAMMAAAAGGAPVTDDVITGGVSVELVHIGSLYHDDVMDDAETRRGVPSVNAKWGNLVAILSGDFLLSRASELAASLGTEVAGLLAATIGRLVRRPGRRTEDGVLGRPVRTGVLRRRSTARRRRCWRPRRASAASSPDCPAIRSTRSRPTATTSAWRSS